MQFHIAAHIQTQFSHAQTEFLCKHYKIQANKLLSLSRDSIYRLQLKRQIHREIY